MTTARRTLPRLLHRAHNTYLRLRKPLTLGARMVVRDGEGRFLLVHHTYRPGWFFPGGGVKKWESFEACAVREAREEAAVEVESGARLFSVYAHFDKLRCDHVALFLADRWRPSGGRLSFEIAEARFFPVDDLPRDIHGATHRRIQEILGHRSIDPVW
ncbi:NUDIX domain-containing protein [Inquilinus limosus]|uniref:NUDIX domain-containing protein n=1 Tax=Inquilinus limosus TaxID=171674 RepID=UPI00068F87CC|nr:NUDIX domain-containing protein [Inquilinus limosus]